MSAQCTTAWSTVATGGCSLRSNGMPSSVSRAATAASCSVSTWSAFDAGDERPNPRNVHLLDRFRMQAGLSQERREIEIGLEAEILRRRRNEVLEPRAELVAAAEMIEDDDPSARTADAPHLARDRYRVGHDADDVRRVDDVERAVGKREVRGIHLEQP